MWGSGVGVTRLVANEQIAGSIPVFPSKLSTGRPIAGHALDKRGIVVRIHSGAPKLYLEVLGIGKPTSLETKGRRKVACMFESCRLCHRG